MITCHQSPCKGLKSRLVATMVMLALVSRAGRFRGQGAAEEPGDAPLPEIARQLAAKLREAMARYNGGGTFRVIFTDTRNVSRMPGKRETLRQQKPLLVSFRGRARYDGDGTRCASGTIRMTPALRRHPFVSRSMDGGVRRSPPLPPIPKAHLRFGEPALSGRRWPPRSVLWENGTSSSGRWS